MLPGEAWHKIYEDQAALEKDLYLTLPIGYHGWVEGNQDTLLVQPFPEIGDERVMATVWNMPCGRQAVVDELVSILGLPVFLEPKKKGS